MADRLIDLLRHGEAVGGQRFRGRLDDPLSGRGWLQLWRATSAAPPWQLIVSSPSRRCSDFARRLAERHGVPLRIDADLAEMDFGDWEGRQVAQLWREEPQQLQRFWDDPAQNPPPNGESLSQLRSRVLRAFARLQESSEPHILVVTHGGPLRLLVAQVVGLPTRQITRLESPHACVSGIRISASGHLSLRFHAAGVA